MDTLTKDISILVAEDEPDLLDEIATFLEFEGFKVLSANNGKTALEMVQQHHPDLVVSDIMMPQLDGYGFLEELRQNPQFADVPFIFLTAKSELRDMRSGMDTGADDYVTKPFQFAELLRAIQTRLNRKQTVKQFYSEETESLRHLLAHALPQEISSPLMLVSGHAERLAHEAEKLSPQQVVEEAKNIYRTTQYLRHIIENHLFYVRLEGLADVEDFKLVLQDDYLPFPSITAYNVLGDLRVIYPQRISDVQLQVPDYPINIAVNYFYKILYELLDNALKFSNPGTDILCQLQADQDTVTLTIKDDGWGIPQNQLARLGTFSASKRSYFEHNRLGLGLCIVKYLIDFYDGQLDIESSIDAGTTVAVTLKIGNKPDWND